MNSFAGGSCLQASMLCRKSSRMIHCIAFISPSELTQLDSCYYMRPCCSVSANGKQRSSRAVLVLKQIFQSSDLSEFIKCCLNTAVQAKVPCKTKHFLTLQGFLLTLCFYRQHTLIKRSSFANFLGEYCR